MDAFQGCYKNGTDGTRDYRYFAGLYHLLPYLVFSNLLGFFLSVKHVEAFVSYGVFFLLCSH